MNKLTSQTNSVEINNIEYPKNSLLIEQSPDEIVIVKNIHTGQVVAQGIYTSWKNSSDAVYASTNALITALRAAIYA